MTPAQPMALAPIALFVYNRPEHTRQTLQYLKANVLAPESDLTIFSDGPRDEHASTAVLEVRRIIRQVDGFGSVTIRENVANRGLAESVIDGVTELCSRRGRVIVLEDDLVTSPWFLKYMNDALNTFEHDERVVSVHGYRYPVKQPLPETFFLLGADCWGWGTWGRGWELFEPDGSKLLARLRAEKRTAQFDFDGSGPYTNMLRDQIAGRNDSWAIRWYASAFLENRFTLYPGRSLIQNIGTDATGTHGRHHTTAFTVDVTQDPVDVTPIPVEDNALARAAFGRFWRKQRGGLPKRLGRRAYRMVSRLGALMRSGA